jgi:hypothetical protein
MEEIERGHVVDAGVAEDCLCRLHVARVPAALHG